MIMKTQNFPEEYLQELGRRIKIIRIFLNLDQRKMSDLMKTGQSQISKIESGRSAPTLFQLRMIKKLADENDHLRENLTWEWILEEKGKGIFG
jgi:transcriptional regulator with XRE-family HTH domain